MGENSKDIKEAWRSLGGAAQFVRASAEYTKVAGLIPGQGTYKNYPMNT